MVLFLHLWGKRTENYSSIFWQNHLLSTMLCFFKDLCCEIHLLLQHQSVSPQLCLATFTSWRQVKDHPRLMWEVSSPNPTNWGGDNLLLFIWFRQSYRPSDMTPPPMPDTLTTPGRSNFWFLFFQQRWSSHKGQLKNLNSKGKAQFHSQISQSK